MSTVNVKGVSHETTEKEVRDFFSFWYVFRDVLPIIAHVY